MPVYEYFCRDCNTKYEKLRPVRDADAPVACPSCNTENSVRALSVFIVHNATGRSASASSADMPSFSGGCGCGGACSCGGHSHSMN